MTRPASQHAAPPNLQPSETSARPLRKRLVYWVLRSLARLVSVIFFRVRCKRRNLAPAAGGALVCSNHQSYFDPVVVGMAFTRRLNYLARETLFRFGPFGWLIRYVDAIPIDRDGMGVGGLKETLRRLRRGEMVLIFPEGTRSEDGEIQPLKPGFVALARRSRTPLLPVAVDGAYEAWPRKALLPRPATIHVCFGEPMSVDHIHSLTDEELIAEVEARIRACQALARQGRRA